MKILQVNKFFYPRGGTETAVFETARLLRSKGHALAFFSMRDERNLETPFAGDFVSGLEFDHPASPFEKARIPGRMLYSIEAAVRLGRLIDREKPDIAHLHNIYHHLSPSVVDILDRRGVPMIMTLHDYKMICPVYSMFRAGRPCQECRGRRFQHCVIHRCTKGSFLKSALAALEMTFHHTIWPIYRRIDVFISPSRFLKDTMSGALPADRIAVWPNVLETRAIRPAAAAGDGSIVYSGRLSAEKGLGTLLNAVRDSGAALRIFGDGPLRGELERKAAAQPGVPVRFGGHLPQDELWREMGRATAAVLPSEWYENNPRSILEAFALGRPVIGSRIGGIPELVREGRTGWLFEPGNAIQLKERIAEAVGDPQAAHRLGRSARAFVEDYGDADRRYPELLRLYERAIALRRRRRTA